MPLQEDFKPGAYQALAAANLIAELGGTDAIWSANSTVATAVAAIRALAVTAGTSQDLIEKVAQGIENGLLAGVIASTHGFSTLAGAIASIAAYLPDAPTTFQGFLPQ